MKRTLLTLAATAMFATSLYAEPKNLLVVSITKGFRHSSIGVAEKVLADLAYRTGDFTVDFASVEPSDDQYKGADGKPDGAKVDAAIDAVLGAKMSPEGLKQYDGVIFVNTTGMLPIPDMDAFLEWIEDGHAFIGMHSATDTLHQRDRVTDFTKMINGSFRTHGPQVEVDCIVSGHDHPATAHLGETFTIYDEIYELNSYDRSVVHALLDLDKNPVSKEPGHYPVSWARNYGKGKVFYTSLGHREDVWDPEWKDNDGNRRNSPEVAHAYQKHIVGGIRWALGLEKGEGKPQEVTYKVSAEERRAGFKPLFNGTSLDGWRLRNPDGRKSWSAENGMLVNRVPKNREGQRAQGVDIVTDQKFWNFQVRFDYMVPEGSNSGFYLRGRHEIQILDGGPGKPTGGSNGSIYNHTPASRNVSRPAGEWQTVDATMIDDRVTVYLNGVRIIDDVRVERPTGSELDGNVNEPGSFFLQGDHGPVAFRNLRVREIK